MEGPPKLDYRSPTKSKPVVPAFQLVIAYALIAGPVVHSCAGSAHAPYAEMVTAVLIAIAAGAGLFVVRRRPNDVVGWIGVIVWGALTLAWLVVPLSAG